MSNITTTNHHDSSSNKKSRSYIKSRSVVPGGGVVVVIYNHLHRLIQTKLILPIHRFVIRILQSYNTNNNTNNKKMISKKGWIIENHWFIHCIVLTIILLLCYILLYILLYRICIKRMIWIYQHMECYTRERSIHWIEGISHYSNTNNKYNISRICPAITQYRTMLQQSQHQQLEKENKISNRMIDPSQICITTLSDTKHTQQQQQSNNIIRCRNFDDVSQYTFKNMYQYSQKYGYTIIDHSNLLDTSRPPAWSKIRAVQAMMMMMMSSSSIVPTTTKTNNDNKNEKKKKLCQWIVWFDADVVIMNSSIRLESILPDITDPKNDNIDLIVTTDRRFTANSGVWIIKNTLWSHNFLIDWWNLKSFIRPSGLSLSGDNDAFGYLIRQHMNIDNPTTSSSSNNNSSSSKIQHIRMIPRCQMNSFGVFIPSSSTTTTKTTALRNSKSLSTSGDTDALVATTDYTNEEWYIHSDQWYYSGDFIAHASGIDQKDVGIQLLLARAV